jgi:hypothetical protein
MADIQQLLTSAPAEIKPDLHKLLDPVLVAGGVLSPNPADRPADMAQAAAQPSARQSVSTPSSALMQEEIELYHTQKSRFLLLSIPTLFAGVVATGAIGAMSGAGQPYPARPVHQDITFSGPAAGRLTTASTKPCLAVLPPVWPEHIDVIFNPAQANPVSQLIGTMSAVAVSRSWRVRHP